MYFVILTFNDDTEPELYGPFNDADSAEIAASELVKNDRVEKALVTAPFDYED